MKKTLYILAVLPLLMLSCVKEQQYTPGTPDDKNCLGVFFPEQEEVSGAHAFDPVQPTTFEVAVVRKVKAGAVTVPCEVVDTAKIFTVSEISFEDGKDTTYIEINFPEAKVGVPYALNLKISGDEYVSKYSTNSPYFSCVITREKWVEIGECEFYDDFFGYDPIQVKIEQNDGNKKQFRLVDPYVQYADLLIADGCGFDPSAADKYLKFELVPKGGTIGGVKITKDDIVDMTSYSTGIDPGYGNVTLYHAKTFSSLCSEDNFAINKVVAYQEDGTPADVQLAPIYYDPDGAWNDGSSVSITILFPGCVRTDYSIEMASYE
ncbi:MAG: hypothetical protein MJY62_06690, partial [Bacteroidales bacterium]|nr:hypothetical protein [Bacteroidales bacterium]